MAGWDYKNKTGKNAVQESLKKSPSKGSKPAKATAPKTKSPDRRAQTAANKASYAKDAAAAKAKGQWKAGGKWYKTKSGKPAGRALGKLKVADNSKVFTKKKK